MTNIELYGGPLDGGHHEVPDEILKLILNHDPAPPSWAPETERRPERLTYDRMSPNTFKYRGTQSGISTGA